MCITTREKSKMFKRLVLGGCVVTLGLGIVSVVRAAGNYGGPYGFGTTATSDQIAEVDIDVMPDGRGLPPGKGTYDEGKNVYMAKCAACHGADLGGVKVTGGAALIGGRGTIGTDKPKKTVESYWPYATTLFDYTKRAMPLQAPGSLTDNEVYALTAYILAEGNVIDKTGGMDANSLWKVQMPNRDGFIRDPRPDVFNYD